MKLDDQYLMFSAQYLCPRKIHEIVLKKSQGEWIKLRSGVREGNGMGDEEVRGKNKCSQRPLHARYNIKTSFPELKS